MPRGEPEIVDLAECLTAMGATIEGQGSERIHIQAPPASTAASHLVLPDRIEAGTYAMAACMTGGNLELVGIEQGMLDSVLRHPVPDRGDGRDHDTRRQGHRTERRAEMLRCHDSAVSGFPTDLQAQLMAYMTRAGVPR